MSLAGNIAADGVLTGLLVSGCASGTLASLRHGEVPREVLGWAVSRSVWKAIAWIALSLSLPVACQAYGMAAGLAAWVTGLMTLGALVVGGIGAWPRLAAVLLIGGGVLASGSGLVWLS